MHSVSIIDEEPTTHAGLACAVMCRKRQSVHSVWKTSIRFTLVTAVLFGLGYPLLMTGLARIAVSASGRTEA